jgi:hypothetical protein
MKFRYAAVLSILALAGCSGSQVVQAPSPVGDQREMLSESGTARMQTIYGDWLTVVETGIDPTGAPYAILHSDPSTFCTWPGGIIWGWSPYLAPPANQITGLGHGNWLFKYFQLGVEQEVSGGFADSCGNTYHSNTVHFTVN